MEFEWDEAKRLSNLTKHRLDFLDAWVIFEGPFIVEAARHQGEERNLAVGLIEDVYVALIFTERGGVVRCISLRRARNDERRRHQALHPGGASREA